MRAFINIIFLLGYMVIRIIRRILFSDASVEEPIGSASLGWDGSIVLNLAARTDDPMGPVGHSQIRIGLGDVQYLSTLHHLGGLIPGEDKQVAPWPE
jgi:hypothetical protein